MMRQKLLATVVLTACTVGEVGVPSTNDAQQIDAPPVSGARLEVTATTTPTATPGYGTRNIVAVWIENNGTFVKTIHRESATRTSHLVAWVTGSGGAGTDTDAVTGATRANHQTPLSFNWDLKDRNETVVPDGTYTVRMELTDFNSNDPAANNQGTFTFTKGAQAQNQPGLTSGGFNAVTLNFVPN